MRLVDMDREGGDLRRLVLPMVGVVLVVLAAAVVVVGREPRARIAPPATAATPAASGGVFVHVAGHVRHPGLYELPPGARVADAIEAAGGARKGADVDALNLAQLVIDGVRIEVVGRAARDTGSSMGSATETVSGTVSVNTASQQDLETIPGIGPVKAAAILSHRDEIGGFQTLEDLLDVSGIGPATLEAIRPYVSL